MENIVYALADLLKNIDENINKNINQMDIFKNEINKLDLINQKNYVNKKTIIKLIDLCYFFSLNTIAEIQSTMSNNSDILFDIQSNNEIWKPKMILENVKHISEKYYLVENDINIEIYDKSLLLIKRFNCDLIIKKNNGFTSPHSLKMIDDILAICFFTFDGSCKYIKCYEVFKDNITKIHDDKYNIHDFNKIKLYYKKGYAVNRFKYLNVNNHIINAFFINDNITDINVTVDNIVIPQKFTYCELYDKEIFVLHDDKIAIHTGNNGYFDSLIIYDLH